MRQFCSTIGVLVLGTLLGAPGTLPASRLAAAGPELKKVHILMVFDTDARELAPSLKLDEARLLRLWWDTIPKDRYRLTVFKGNQVNRAEILRFYRGLQVSPGEGLLFYYGGHGAIDKKTGEHFFELSNGKPLFRREVVKAMEDSKADLVLVLSDCCSTPKVAKVKDLVTDRALTTGARALHPTVRNLLFQSRGTVDVTAATDNASWGDNLEGGLFTRSLSRVVQLPLQKLDTDRDGSITWDEFFPQLQTDTKKLFEEWRKQMIARGEEIDTRTQVPHAFKHRAALVCIENGTAGPLAYQARWPGEEWTAVTLKAGERRVHRLVLPGREQTLPKLEAKFTGVRQPQQLTAADWTGLGEPSEPEKTYRIRPRPR